MVLLEYVCLKVVRTLTGHRSNCISLDFHPFGEFFASGSLDTNLKIWDIRRKGCIHTYKGHTRGVNVIRFTPDGRWVVSGGEDNSVKVRTYSYFRHAFGIIEGIETQIRWSFFRAKVLYNIFHINSSLSLTLVLLCLQHWTGLTAMGFNCGKAIT